MVSSGVRLDDYWQKLAGVLPEFLPAQQHTAVALYRELAKGQPMTIERVASALGVSSEKAAEGLARDPLRSFVHAARGQIVGFGGSPRRRCIMNSE
jgi:hypothetical protein